MSCEAILISLPINVSVAFGIMLQRSLNNEQKLKQRLRLLLLLTFIHVMAENCESSCYHVVELKAVDILKVYTTIFII